MIAIEQRVDREKQARTDSKSLWLLLIETREMVVEMRRENRQTRRIWIAIARKQELFDDDEFRDVLGDERRKREERDSGWSER